jgi:hypothetical protein
LFRSHCYTYRYSPTESNSIVAASADRHTYRYAPTESKSIISASSDRHTYGDSHGNTGPIAHARAFSICITDAS